MSVAIIGLIGIAALLLLLALNKPVAFAMALVGFVGFSALTSFSAGLNMVSNEMYNTFSSYSLGVIPMFVWMGYLAYHSGIGADLYDFAYKMIGHWPGGLAVSFGEYAAANIDKCDWRDDEIKSKLKKEYGSSPVSKEMYLTEG